MSSQFGHQLKISIFGQSHSAGIGVVIDGLPAGEPIDLDEVAAFMARRAPGNSPASTARKEADIPLVKMQHFSELADDEQVVANGYIQDVAYPSGVVYKVASSPIEMDSVGTVSTEPTRAVGADTRDVLTGYGYTEEQLQSLRNEGVIN